jgi:hypothetical protein
MAYLRGDYYRGDYRVGAYRGDGIFSSIGSALGKVFKFGAKNILPLALGGPVGELVSTGIQLASANTAAGKVLPGPLGAAARASGAIGTFMGSPFRSQHSSAPGNPSNLPMQIGAPPLPMLASGGGGGMRRVHPNRSTYVTRGGGTSRWPVGLAVHPKGTELVPSRRMNVANPRALRRALRRVAGFGKIVKRSRRAIAMAASAVGVHHRRGKAVARRK